ncbi:MAG: hypothetical protein HY303_13465 [Candidatus Wallbacteria bacterium]|nr:hypothetical protein [Candidatus Wallbacteria bacterium]
MQYTRIRGLLAAALFISIAPLGALQAGQVVVPKTTVVHVDESSAATLQNFLAAVPANIFHRESDRYQSVLISDDTNLSTNKYLLDDWAAYLAATGANQSIVFVGDVPEATRQGIQATLNCTHCSTISGADPSVVARRIAKDNWTASQKIVVAPSVTDANDTDIQNAANAAVYASMVNAPLLFAKDGVLDDATLEIAHSLGAKECVIFDLGGRLNAASATALSAAGLVTTFSAKTERDIVSNMLATAGSSTTCLFADKARSLAATIAGACYGGTVMKVPAGIAALSVQAYKSINPLLMSDRKLEAPFQDDPAAARTEQQIADAFYKWLSERGGEDANKLETVMVFAAGSVSTGVPLTLERSLIGDPRKQTDRGAIASRMPGSCLENIAYINRTSLYKALIFSNPRWNRVLCEMVAYECQNLSGESTGPTEANDGKKHVVNEFFGCKEQGHNDPGVYSTFKDRGYGIGFHSGRDSDMNVEDPINHEKAWGFWKDIKDGVGYAYYSGHGSTDAFYALDTDNGIQADQEFGTANWPSSGGRVNHSGSGYQATTWNDDQQNIHGAGLAFNACLIGGGSMNNILMEHGAAFVMTNYVSGSFDGGGLAFCTLADEMSKDGRTIGEAHAMALSAISEIFAAHRPGKDSSMRFALYGDCRMEYAKPNWTRPSPASSGAVAGHKI